ncbi:MAG: DUF3794 domain-containing protein [Ruminococcaceae bacterium]|nr:DUF3794 domain-containing protein [Oscillospiraceae bacterium]
MDTQKEFLCLEKNCKIYSKAVDVEGDYQESLPAYLDDIFRVVKCASNSYITSADISFNEVKIYGKTEIQITYYNEDSNLCFADFEEEFSKTVSVDNLSDSSFVRAYICDKYVNFRVINQRRIDFHTMSVLSINVYDSVKYPTVCSLENAKLKKESINTSDIVASHIDKIDFDEEVTVPSDSKPVSRVVSWSAHPSLTDIKVIKDKLFVKAMLKVFVLYTTDESEDVENAEYTFSLSKIIDKAGLEEDDIVVADLNTGTVFIKVKGNGDVNSTLNIFGEISVNLTFVRESTAEVITDGYLLGAKSECNYSSFEANTDGRAFADSRMINTTLEFNGDTDRIYELSLRLKDVNYKDGRITANVDATAITGGESGLASLNTSSEIDVPLDNFDEAVVSMYIDDYDYTISSSGKIDLRLSLGINAYCYNQTNVPVLADITEGEQTDETHTLTVYFGKANEKVWDIAKNFMSDENEIINENALKSDVLDTPTVLIIPRVKEAK